MPAVLRFDGLRAVIYPNDHEPAHVRVVGEGHVAVFHLRCPHGPPALRANHRFPRHRLAAIKRRLAADLSALCSAWGTIHGHS
jgi:Domain of unknown function (DUF4160)